MRFEPSRPVAACALAACAVLLAAMPAFAIHCWDYTDTQPSTNPRPWSCATPDPGAQLIIHEHANWHCSFPPANNETWGRRFIAFHSQFILDYDLWRTSNLFDRLETWEVGPNAPIPGDDETTATGFTHCLDAGDVRPAGALCGGCLALPSDLVGDSNLDDFATLGAVGARLNSSNWHGSFHTGAGATGCNDVGVASTAPRDPAFWMGHKKLDVLARDWQRLMPADIVIVIDRSGSMNDDCDSALDCTGPNPPADSGCKLNQAKAAARLFVDLIQDDRPAGGEHQIALVSFAGAATTELGFTDPDGIVTDNALDDTPFEAALAAIEACGGTSIGAGIQQAVTILAGGANPYQAILVLTDGLENVAPSIDDVEGTLGNILLCAIGIGEGAAETELRDAAEAHGGIFVAESDIADDGVTLEKFFVAAFGQIFDEVINDDPVFLIPAGAVSSPPLDMPVTTLDSRLAVVAGWGAPGAPDRSCAPRLVVETPAGDLVDPDDPLIEAGGLTATFPGHTFQRIPLPWRGEGPGMWRAALVRPQRAFVHGFATDAIVDRDAAVNLVRREMHRLFPRGCGTALYYEDGSASGFSAYREALQRELAGGSLGSLVTAADAGDFLALLVAGGWDMVVFARQVNPSPQPFDATLQQELCRGQAALITDFFAPAGGVNPILVCAGVTAQPSQFTTLTGDGRLLVGTLPLTNPGYPTPTRTLIPSAIGGPPALLQGFFTSQDGAIAGSGSSCEDQFCFMSTQTRGIGRVEPQPTQPRVLVGQRIRPSFRITESNRPANGWDAVTATVALTRPGMPKKAEIYTLYDDGTNGDKAAMNGYWSTEILPPATEPGPHQLVASFQLTEGNDTLQREAAYTVIVEDEPSQCGRLNCPPRIEAQPGWTLRLPACAVNLCSDTGPFRVQVVDRAGWLCTVDAQGDTIPAGPVETTIDVGGSKAACLFETEEFPYFIRVPAGAAVRDSTVVLTEIVALGLQGQEPRRCSTTIMVFASALVDVPDVQAPDRPALTEIRPNPFNPRTEIRFALPDDAGAPVRVSLRIYDLGGRLVRTLAEGSLPPGEHAVVWTGDREGGGQVSSGVYFATLEAAGARDTRKLMLIR